MKTSESSRYGSSGNTHTGGWVNPERLLFVFQSLVESAFFVFFPRSALWMYFSLLLFPVFFTLRQVSPWCHSQAETCQTCKDTQKKPRNLSFKQCTLYKEIKSRLFSCLTDSSLWRHIKESTMTYCIYVPSQRLLTADLHCNVLVLIVLSFVNTELNQSIFVILKVRVGVFFFTFQALAEEMDANNERLGWLNKHAPQILSSSSVSPQSRDEHVGKLRVINLNWSKVRLPQTNGIIFQQWHTE